MLYALFSLVAVAYSIPSTIRQGDTEYVSTPVGYRPRQCVHMVEEDNHVIDVSNEDVGVTVYYPDSDRSVFFPTLPECVANARVIREGLRQKRKVVEQIKKQKPELYKNLGDGWQIYGSFYLSKNDAILLNNFSVSYTVPNENMRDYGQIMYYFIGSQNNDDRNTVTIIQPVITYCNSGCDPISAIPGWSGTSWNCCPGGQSHFSKPIALSAGDSNVLGWAYSDSTSGTVQIYTEYNGETSFLNLTGDNRQYDWVDVTLEAYNYGRNCDAFNSQPFGFYNMLIEENNQNTLKDLEWQIINNHLCDGNITFDSTGANGEIVGNGE